MEYFRIRNGKMISAIGYGTYPVRKDKLFKVIPQLNVVGINLVDTAHDYKNEGIIGVANRFNRKQNLILSSKMSVGQQRLGGGVIHLPL